MFTRRSKLSVRTKPSRKKAWVHLVAAIIGALPTYGILIGFHLGSDQPLSIQSFIVYLSVISPLTIVIALLVLRVLCEENPQSLNLKPSRLLSDVIAAFTLTLVIIVANLISNQLLSELIPDSVANTAVRNLFIELASNPELLILFLGLLIPLGAASEEVMRVFLLSRLWKVWPSTRVKLITVVISACLFGLAHLYRGPSGVVWTAILGLIMALHYLRFGRPVPLIVAHYLSNSLQVVIFVVSAP